VGPSIKEGRVGFVYYMCVHSNSVAKQTIKKVGSERNGQITLMYNAVPTSSNFRSWPLVGAHVSRRKKLILS